MWIYEKTVTEITAMYSKISLLELLAEENMMVTLLHRKALDPIREALQKILRLEIEKRLR